MKQNGSAKDSPVGYPPPRDSRTCLPFLRHSVIPVSIMPQLARSLLVVPSGFLKYSPPQAFPVTC